MPTILLCGFFGEEGLKLWKSFFDKFIFPFIYKRNARVIPCGFSAIDNILSIGA